MKTTRLLLVFTLAAFSCQRGLESKLDELLANRVTGTGPGCAVLVLKNGTVLLEACRGLADLNPATPITSRTNFRLASVTKQFTATAVLLLVSDGKLQLHQTLTEIFPEFPSYGQTITIHQLLTHTSGLADYESLMPDTTTVPVLDADALRLLEAQTATLFVPGSEFRYSNSGYAVLAQVVERVSGMRFADFLKVRIFDPLGMTNTVAFENGRSTVASRAFGHSPGGDDAAGFLETDQSLTSSVLGDGGVYSSLEDLRRWAMELDQPSVLDSVSLRRAMSPQVPTTTEGESYGYGWFVGENEGVRMVRHSGSTIGFRTEIQRYPERGLTIIVLANRADLNATDLATALARELIR